MRTRNLMMTILFALLLLPAVGWGEIEKEAITTDSGFQLYWWPKLPPIGGWESDRDASLHYAVNALVPKGKSFAEAETVMYAKAIYKPGIPEAESVDDLIKSDIEHFKEEDPSITVTQLADVTDGDNKKLKIYEFVPAGDGNWEAVAYGSEGDFYLIFTVSSQNASGYKSAFPQFAELLGKYKEKLTSGDDDTAPGKLDSVPESEEDGD